MFAINDFVFYGTTGVCQIVDFRTEKIGSSKAQEYYVLKPVFTPGSTLYVCASDDELVSHMRPTLTKEAVYSLIDTMPTEEEIWICDDRDRDREYGAKIRSGDCHEFIKIIKALYLERERKKETGKRLNAMDARLMATAEKLLHEEFAFVLGIDPKEIVSFIQSRISNLVADLH